MVPSIIRRLSFIAFFALALLVQSFGAATNSSITVTSATNLNVGSIVITNGTASALLGLDSGKKSTSATLTVTEAGNIHTAGLGASATVFTVTSTNAALKGNLTANGGVFTNTLTLGGTSVSDAAILASGTIAQARLGTGSGGAGTKFLADDQTYKTVSGTGDVTGPSSSTNNNVPRFSGTGGKTLKDSSVNIDDSGNIVTPGSITSGQGSGTAGSTTWGDGGSHSFRINPQTMSGNVNFQPDTSAQTGIPLHTATSTNVVETHLGTSGSGNVPRVTGATVNNWTEGNPTITFPVINYSYLGTNNTSFGFYMTGVTNSSGSTISQWAAVYIKSDGSIDLADANGSGTYPSWGLAAASISNGSTGTIITMGNVRNDSWSFTPGATVWLSTTAGSLTTTQPATTGDKIQAVGKALTATQLLLRPSQDYGTAP